MVKSNLIVSLSLAAFLSFIHIPPSFADNKTVVIPLGKSASMDVVVVRESNSTSYLCNTLQLVAKCPTGYKVTGGSISCGADGFLFTSNNRAVKYSTKSWGAESWGGSCTDLVDSDKECSPAFVEAICLKVQ